MSDTAITVLVLLAFLCGMGAGCTIACLWRTQPEPSMSEAELTRMSRKADQSMAYLAQQQAEQNSPRILPIAGLSFFAPVSREMENAARIPRSGRKKGRSG